MDIRKIVNGALFEVKYDEMVVVKDIEFFSMCEHHMLPFFGRMHVAYLPRTKVIGLSKIPRIVDAFARRLQIQERLTQEVAHAGGAGGAAAGPGRGASRAAGPASDRSRMMNCTRRFRARFAAVTFGTRGLSCPYPRATKRSESTPC